MDLIDLEGRVHLSPLLYGAQLDCWLFHPTRAPGQIIATSTWSFPLWSVPKLGQQPPPFTANSLILYTQARQVIAAS